MPGNHLASSRMMFRWRSSRDRSETARRISRGQQRGHRVAQGLRAVPEERSPAALAGRFPPGRANYAKKLLYEEMVDIPLDRLLADRLRRPARQSETIRRDRRPIDPGRRRSRSWRSWRRIIPRRTSCWMPFATPAAGCASSSSDHKIVTIPSPVLPILEETPPFMRALTFASMDTPGPYETVAKEAFFNVTLPEKDWPQGSRGRFHGRLQSRHDPQHRDSRSVSGPLRAVPVDAARRLAASASCWARIRTPKAGRTTASR